MADVVFMLQVKRRERGLESRPSSLASPDRLLGAQRPHVTVGSAAPPVRPSPVTHLRANLEVSFPMREAEPPRGGAVAVDAAALGDVGGPL